MKSRDILENIQIVYHHLADDESREIYAERLFYNLSGNESFNGNNESYMISIYRILFAKNGILEMVRKYPHSKKIIFGAGQWGKKILQLMPELDISYFVDNNGLEKEIQGIPVVTFDEMIRHHRDAVVIISSTKFYEEMYQQILNAGMDARQICLLGKELKEFQEANLRKTYFDLQELPHVSHEIFVDAGGFDGMTSRLFCQWCQNDYEKIYVFEPNDMLYRECRENLTTIRNCKLIKRGLWSHNTELKLYEDRNHQFKLIDLDRDIIGSTSISVVSLDSYIPDVKVTFIKMDIEGSEEEALKGSSHIIRTYKPKMAISVYHKKDDLWILPMLLLSYRSDYRFYVRHYTLTRYETVLYAV